MRRISELHPYLLFLLAGHALIRSLQPLYFYQEQQNYIPSPPTPSSGAKIDINAVDSPALKQDLSDFIQAFQHVVQKKVERPACFILFIVSLHFEQLSFSLA